MGVKRAGLICLGLILAAWAASLPLRCPLLAAWVAGVSGLTGALCGLFLALVTRTCRPVLIYAFLALAGLMLWPLYNAWPHAGGFDVTAWPDAPQFVFTYFSLLRPIVFVLALPVPFAAVGQHGPDLLPVHDTQAQAALDKQAQVVHEEQIQQQQIQQQQVQERHTAQNKETETP